MLNAIEISPKVWWVGGIDWNERLFHGYTTEAGITYNAYLIMDEKIASSTPARPRSPTSSFSASPRWSTPPRSTSSSPTTWRWTVPVPCRDPQDPPTPDSYAGAGVKEFYAHFGIEATPVKSSNTLCIGERTLTFVTTPMVHWPDNMVTYSDVDQIVFSNDAFGSTSPPPSASMTRTTYARS